MGFDGLKDHCEKTGSAISVKIRKSGEAFIYVSPDCDEKELSKSLLMATAEIIKAKEGE